MSARPVDVSFCDIEALTRRCEEAWGREVDSYAAAYLARLMVRLIHNFGKDLPANGGKVTVRHMYHAASIWLD